MDKQENNQPMHEQIKQLKLQLKELPSKRLDGRLEIKTNSSRPEYFHCYVRDGIIHKDYIPKSQIQKAKCLAQQSYQDHIQHLLDELSHKKNMTLETFNAEIDSVYMQMHPLRRALVTPVRVSSEEQFELWKKRGFQALAFRENDPAGIITNRNERVRSKSEKILADLFAAEGIFYKYECPLYLQNNVIFYPDFTFYNPKTQQEIYWEHFGRMDLSEYSIKFVTKIRLYEENGIYLGNQLITTYEGGSLVIDTKRALQLIERFDLRLCSI